MKRINKILSLCIAGVLCMAALVGCGNKVSDDTYNKEKVTVKVAALKGPTGMGMVQLMDQNDKGESEEKYNFEILGSPDQIVGKVVNGDVDIAAVPTNLASVLYAKTKGEVLYLATNTLGVLHILENGNEIQSFEDLKGKKIVATGKGATPEYILNYLLQKNGIDKDVEVEYLQEHSELAAKMVAGEVKIGVLPQPLVTTTLMKNKDVRLALDLTKEWEKVEGDKSKLAMGCVIVSKEFAKNNKEVVDNFLEEYKKSINFVNENREDAAKLIEKYKIVPNAKIAELAIDGSNITFINSEDSKDMINEFFKILFKFDPKSIGGKLPDEGFYYSK